MPWSRRSTDRFLLNGGTGVARTMRERLGAEGGSASLEFLIVGLVLLVPLVYLVVAMASIQAAALGVEGAARQAARVAVLRGDGAPAASVERTVRVVLADYGVDADTTSVAVDCSGRCDEPGTRITVRVGAVVVLPLVPQALAASSIGTVRVDGIATHTVSRFAGAS